MMLTKFIELSGWKDAEDLYAEGIGVVTYQGQKFLRVMRKPYLDGGRPEWVGTIDENGDVLFTPDKEEENNG